MTKKNQVEQHPDIRHYRKRLRELQIELVKLQRHLIRHDLKIVVLFEGRDAAGKDGTIKRITEHLSPRETRVVALGKPTERDQSSWYFQRYVQYLPAEQEMVLFNRSWYNRAGVERVMGFCSDQQYRDFMETVLPFEHLLLESGVMLFKFYLDISKDVQRKRLDDRKKDPLKHWKVSPIDAVAIEKWDEYSTARNDMLRATSNTTAPWHVVRADNKKRARLDVIRHLIEQVNCPERSPSIDLPDPEALFRFNESNFKSGKIAP